MVSSFRLTIEKFCSAQNFRCNLTLARNRSVSRDHLSLQVERLFEVVDPFRRISLRQVLGIAVAMMRLVHQRLQLGPLRAVIAPSPLTQSSVIFGLGLQIVLDRTLAPLLILDSAEPFVGRLFSSAGHTYMAS
ncbi:hypothetical protein QOV31_005180 (plasmid) [Agrobacterium fabrum]|nr:hypothetical protein QOV31_005180 [Agrobacterium fabrum]